MAGNNKRRAAKQRARAARGSGRERAGWPRAGTTERPHANRGPETGSGPRAGSGSGIDAADLPALVLVALGAALHGDRAGVDDAVDRLDAAAATGQEADVARLLASELSRRLRRAWEKGWQPVDVVTVVRRWFGASHATVVAIAVAHDARLDRGKPMHPQWAAQLADLGGGPSDADRAEDWLSQVVGSTRLTRRDAIEASIELLARLSVIPTLPTLIPPPGPGADRVRGAGTSDRGAGESDRRAGADGRARRELDQKMLGRVRALLAKAESTVFPEEAEAFTVKAQELMTRHAIDAAMLDPGGGLADGPEARRIHLDPPYADAKSALAAAVASANRCRVVFHPELGFVTVFGFGSDLMVVEVLFTSLLAQATTALVAAGKVLDRAGNVKTKSFRHSFLFAFATRIGQRLREAAEATLHDVEQEQGRSMLPVLAGRERAVEEATAAVFGKLRTKSTRVSNEAGWIAGKLAADQASLGSWSQVGA